MKRHSKDYASMGLNALRRATHKALERARRNNLQVPIWENGRIRYIYPKIDTEEGAPPDRYSTALHSGR